ncbi:unnamed protein product, partial [Polarella glacialis]
VTGLAGDVVASFWADASLNIGEVKRLISEQRPQAAPCWQRLLWGSRELVNEEALGPALADRESPGPAVLQLILAVDPRDLLIRRMVDPVDPRGNLLRRPNSGDWLTGSKEEKELLMTRQEQAARAIDAMGRELVACN